MYIYIYIFIYMVLVWLIKLYLGICIDASLAHVYPKESFTFAENTGDCLFQKPFLRVTCDELLVTCAIR